MAAPFSTRHGIEIEGFGVGLRRAHWGELHKLLDGVDWLEVISENFMSFGGEPRRILDEVRTRRPVVPHGVNLSVGGPDPLRRDYLVALKGLSSHLDAPYVSDHLCFGSVAGSYAHDLLPLPHSEAAIRHVAGRARQVAEVVERPLVLENISTYAIMPGGELSEAEFVASAVEEADCGLLLDVNNIFVNATNHGFDARAYLDRIPMDRVVQIHLAGHREEDDLLVDDHAHPVRDEVWALYAAALRRAARLIPTLIEWDHQLPSVERLLAELTRARLVATAALDEAHPPLAGAA